AGTHCDIWLLLHKNTADFKAYNIGINGINLTPVVSANVGNFAGYDAYKQGHMEVSPVRTKLVVCSAGSIVATAGSELCTFDPATGTVSNAVLLTTDNTLHITYGAAFSPDNTKLYTEDTYTGDITQYDVTLPAAQIPASA